MIETIAKVVVWADNKNLLRQENSLAQMAKVTEEVGEIASALIRKDMVKLKDGIGDTVVTLILLAEQNGLSLEECLEAAWKEIKDRTGKTNSEGCFIKD